MSISDLIVVMKEGVVQQIGKPQQVYDDPANLFVAQFLGTPPIATFTGSVKEGKLYIGETPVMDVAGDCNGPVVVGVRPEGFVPDPEGTLVCGCRQIEVMGRDTSVVCEHPCFIGSNFRAIIDAEDICQVKDGQIRFRLRKNKVFLFDSQTGSRIY